MRFFDSKISLERSWKFTPQTIFLIVLGIIVILGILIFILRPEKAPLPQPEVSLPVLPETIEEILKPGGVGEIPEAERPEVPSGTPELPPVIFNTSGKIIEVKTDRLIVEGSGSNFADQKPRNLTVIFISSTITFEPGQKVKYQGLDGLQYLKTGMNILIEGEENLRGKTEFFARTINIL